jgi:putative flippase GtrA
MKLSDLVLRFASVGLMATGVHYGAGLSGLLAGLSPEAANLIGFGCAFAAAYLGHRHFTYRDQALPRLRPLLRYSAVSAGSFAAGQTLLSKLTDLPWLPDAAALLAALACSAAVNCALSTVWAFAGGQDAQAGRVL